MIKWSELSVERKIEISKRVYTSGPKKRFFKKIAP